MRNAMCAGMLGALLSLSVAGVAVAQESAEPDLYVGGVVGIAALSVDATSGPSTSGEGFIFSHYEPTNGPSVNLFGGIHLTNYVTLQANYRWNRNDFRSVSGGANEMVGRFDEQFGRSRQHAVVGDFLLYFRERASRFRPYLSAGVGAVWVSSEPISEPGTPADDAGGVGPDSPVSFTETVPVLRVAVGIDVAIATHWEIRYSFSEGIGPNPFTDRLSSPGTRSLMNFQNLVGVLYTF